MSARGTLRPCDSPAMRRVPMALSSLLVVREVCCAHIGVVGFERQKYSKIASISDGGSSSECRFIQRLPGETKTNPNRTRKCSEEHGNPELSKNIEENLEVSRTKKVAPGTSRNSQGTTESKRKKQEHTERTAAARHSFGRQQNCTRHRPLLIACSVAHVARSTPAAYSRQRLEPTDLYQRRMAQSLLDGSPWYW